MKHFDLQQASSKQQQSGGTLTMRMESSSQRAQWMRDQDRRRTEALGRAFRDLREHLPCIPPDTKVSKLRTLRLATEYLTVLTSQLSTPPAANDEYVDTNVGARVGDPPVTTIQMPPCFETFDYPNNEQLI